MDIEIGDTVRITDSKSSYYGQKGIVVDKGKHGGLYVEHRDGKVVYHPWGYTIVND